MKKPEKLLPNYAFIDSQNLNLGIKSLGWNLDYRKFRLYLKNKFNISHAFLFIGYIAGNEKLYLSLQKYGYILKFKPTLAVAGKTNLKVKGNVDAELVLHTMIEFKKYNKAVIVSGDGDFYCLVEHLVENKKLAKVLVPNHKYSSLLRKFNDGNYISQLEILKSKLELG